MERKKVSYRLFVSAILLFALVLPAAACGGSGEYTVTYRLNYAGAGERIVRVIANEKAVDWKPFREGYRMTGWYTDSSATEKFDFNRRIKKNVTLYANWKVSDLFTVQFDYNYYGSMPPVRLHVKSGETIDADRVPKSTRIGHTFSGWYQDKACAVPFDSDTPIEEDTVLYAGYELKPGIPRNEDGSIKYENTVVNVWVYSDFGMLDGIEAIAAEFNAAHEGKISVNISTDLLSQNTFSLRFEQIPERNVYDYTYYPAADIYDLAGIEYNLSDFYTNMAREAVIDTRLSAVPVVARVPYVIYNRDLMAKYNASETLPSNFSEVSKVIERARQGEGDGFGGIANSRSWSFYEAVSYIAFAQNGADYYEYRSGHHVNRWNEEGRFEKAKTAYRNTYDMLSVFGKNHALVAGNERDSAVKAVAAGEALIGIIHEPADMEATVDNPDIGIMPLSGLFTDERSGVSGQVPVHTFGMGFYKALSVSETELAAGALFTDYLVKNTYRLAEKGWYPAVKPVTGSAEWKNSDNAYVNLLKAVGNPVNFRTLDGNRHGKEIVRTAGWNNSLRGALDDPNPDIEKLTKSLMNSMKGYLY